MADAKKLMSRKDRKEFQWTLEEYEQHAKADLLSGVTSANVMNASANWHLSYLDGMKLQLEHHVDKLYKNIDSKTRNHFKDSLNENYLNTAFELQKGIGIGEKMEVPYDERKLENILRTPWASDGKNFSQRIWKDRTQLVNNLQRNLSESVIRGDSDTDMIQALSKDEKRAEFNTRRLIETESAYFDSLSEQECCEDFGVEKYRFLAVLDMKTSDICQELDNKVFLEKERQVGVNAPPMHPFCRSTTAPVIDEEFLTSRRAKNPKTGEYDEIPADMNYKQWKEKYVEGKENAEEVKQEQVKVPKETERGYKLEVPAKEVNTSEGETVYTNTAIPPKEENQITQNVEQKLVSKTIQEETKEYLKNNYGIENQNIHLEKLNDDVVTSLKDGFSDIKNVIVNARGKDDIKFDDVLKTVATSDVFFNEAKEAYIENEWQKEIKKQRNKFDETALKKWITVNEITLKKGYENDFFQQCGLDTNTNHLAFTVPINKGIIKDNLIINNKIYNLGYLSGIYLVKDQLNGYDTQSHEDELQYHPPKCYNNKGNITHELGHILDYKFKLSSRKKIRKLYIDNFLYHYNVFVVLKDSYKDDLTALNRMKSLNKDFLSIYAFEDGEKKAKIFGKQHPERFREFIAEAVSEVLTVGYDDARKIAKDVWDEIIIAIREYNP